MSVSDIPVLVVDDQPDIRLLVRTLFIAENHGLRVEGEAGSGEEAVDHVRRLGSGDISVVVLDQMMPGMTGIETARALLADDPSLRIVLFSAYLDDALRREAAEAGIAMCVDKRDFSSLAPVVRTLAA